MRLNMPMKSLTLTTTLAAAALLFAQPAAAQASDTKSPVDITADEAEVIQSQCMSIWRGSAEALQDQARLRANVIRAYFAPKPKTVAAPAGSTSACGELLRMEAEGQVFYVTADQQRVRANAAIYDASKDTVVMTGDVVAVQGENVLRGERMVYNTKTGQGQMQGGGKGGKNRPRGVFYPKQDNTPAAPKPGQSR
jgi:lipopolysaccharide export system protein LptA